ncbi:efflux RND transporter periplasmic adaptor subunit [Shewanella gelidii]|uniref:Lipoprotein n=1 Tax=Shewanella gelidii TaxID=1642821 RepID=A0A917JPM5_9GAMM|nr:efflux RND transporter periplasmic adaptor subunit [Shewanella gelidii]MCL1099472.1 efflux RND transporter periplasmic adaptor subunit [Shewanella gelidii]GGI77250.1 lipoprotein [Shewanella gelidii]
MRLYTVALAVAAASSMLVGCGKVESKVEPTIVRPVKLFQVDNFDRAEMRVFPAKVKANKQAELAFRIGGELNQLPLLEGQVVVQGQVLAHLDDRDAKNQVLLREADYELALSDFRRQTLLRNQELISKAEFDNAQAKLKSAKANLATAQDQLSYTQLKAPFSGTIAKRFIDNFQTVQAGVPILTLQRNDAVDVVIQVSESLVQATKDKDSVEDMLPQVSFANDANKLYPVTFKEFSSQVSPGTQTYEATFTLQQPKDIQVLPGMSAELRVQLVERGIQTLAIVPVAAVGKGLQPNQSLVWLFDEAKGSVRSAPVTLGEVRSQGIEILSGIKPGEKVVAAGIQHLSEGMLVKPLRWERGV